VEGTEAGAGASAETIRALAPERDVDERYLHVSAAQAREAVHGGFYGRPLPLRGQPHARAPSEELAGDGGAASSGVGVRLSEGPPDGPGQAVRGVEGRDGLPEGAAHAGHRAHDEPASASPDPRKDRKMVEDALGRVSLEDDLCRLRRLHPQGEAVCGLVQLQAPEPGHRRSGARGSFLSRGAAPARGGGEQRCRERP